MYNGYFGLREKPFDVTPDPRIFYINDVIQDACSRLLYGIRERKGFIVLTGEVGTGKTTLLRRLVQELEPTTHCVFPCYTKLNFEELLDSICKDLGLLHKQGSKYNKIERLSGFLIEQLAKEQTVAFLLDEAQSFDEEVLEDLRLLSNLETMNEKLLQIVLVGQPELCTRLDQPRFRQIKQRVAVWCQLDRLKDREVGPFIRYRLQAVGYKGPAVFGPEAIQSIALYSKGIPRLINVICDNALLMGYVNSQKNVSAKIIDDVAKGLHLKEKAPVANVGISTGRAPKTRPASLIKLEPAITPQIIKENALQALKVEAPQVGLLEPVSAPLSSTKAAESSVVSPQFFDKLTHELTEAMGPMASIVLNDVISGLGENRDNFPKIKIAGLVELVSEEISEEAMKAKFVNSMFENIVTLYEP